MTMAIARREPNYYIAGFANGSDPSHLEVYPRVGGGTVDPTLVAKSNLGLSPRGRGNPEPFSSTLALSRSIPAWAGEPRQGGWRRSCGTVYPRVGGGTVEKSETQVSYLGLSPRGRGNLTPVLGSVISLGSIPAWAGEPCYHAGANSTGWVYPRVGGGTSSNDAMNGACAGLSPRGRGNRMGRR